MEYCTLSVQRRWVVPAWVKPPPAVPRVTFLLNHQSTNLSVAGWIGSFFSTVRDITTILKNTREMARESTSESKSSPNENNTRNALTDGQLIRAFFLLSFGLGLGLIFTTWIGCWLGMLTSIMSSIDWSKCLMPHLPAQVVSPADVIKFLVEAAQRGAAQVPGWLSLPGPGNTTTTTAWLDQTLAAFVTRQARIIPRER